VRHGEAASSDAKAAEAFVAEFQKLMVSECYLPQQVFNCEETVFWGEKMPKRTYITAEENAMLGHKPMKDRLTLLLCANASGDFKVKPLLVYHSENPRVFKKCKVQKSQLNVMWRSNSKAWVTRILFVEWIKEVFGPAVKKYLLEKNYHSKSCWLWIMLLLILQALRTTYWKNSSSLRSSSFLPTLLHYSSPWISRSF
jgi:hypothetical protein